MLRAVVDDLLATPDTASRLRQCVDTRLLAQEVLSEALDKAMFDARYEGLTWARIARWAGLHVRTVRIRVERYAEENNLRVPPRQLNRRQRTIKAFDARPTSAYAPGAIRSDRPR